MTLDFYRVLHLLGIFMLLFALGGMNLHMINGGSREFKSRKWAAIIHGLGLVITLIAGFGLLAKLQLSSAVPAWAWAKLAIWLVLGAYPAIYYRRGPMAKLLFATTMLFALAAAWLGIYKPF